MNILIKRRKKLKDEIEFGNPYEKGRVRFKEFFNNLGMVRTIAWGALLFLTFADVLTLFDLFRKPEFDLSIFFAGVIALTCALFLEGIPYIMGDGLNRLLDKKKKSKKNERKKTRLWFIASIFAGVIVMVALIFFRIEVVFLSVGDEKTQLVEILSGVGHMGEKIRDAYMLLTFGLEDSDEVAANIYLAVQPILTSILAFMISFAYLSGNSEDRNRQLERKFKKRIQRAKLNNDANRRILERAKLDLISDLGIDREAEMLTSCSNDDFVRKIFRSITAKVNRMAINGYVTSVHNYNLSVEAQLKEYLSFISSKSNMPHLITGIDIQSVVKEFDSENEDLKKWNADAYVKKSAEILKRVLFNEMIIKLDNVKAEEYVVNEENTSDNKGGMPKKDISRPEQEITGEKLSEMRQTVSEEEEEVEVQVENIVVPVTVHTNSDTNGQAHEESGSLSERADVTKEFYSESLLSKDGDEPFEYDGIIVPGSDDMPQEYGGAVSHADDGPMEYDGKLQ